MTAFRRSTVDQAARWLRSRFRPGALILVYHRVGEAGIDPFRTSVDAENFDETLHMGELVEPLGFDSIWATEHYGSAYSMQPIRPSKHPRHASAR